MIEKSFEASALINTLPRGDSIKYIRSVYVTANRESLFSLDSYISEMSPDFSESLKNKLSILSKNWEEL